MSLLDNLISYWKLDEASGNALDAHGSNELTDNATVGSAAGKINNGRDFELSSSEYFSRADNTDLSTGDIDFTFAVWVKLEQTGINNTLIAKWRNSGALREYLFDIGGNVGTRARFIVYADGSTAVTVTANTFGNLSTATWYFIVAWHDSSANTINIQVNNGTADSTAHSGGVIDTATAFHIGSRLDSGGNAEQFLDAVADEIGFWKRVLTADERTSLYNGGDGLSYDSFGGAAGQPTVKRFGGVAFAAHGGYQPGTGAMRW